MSENCSALTARSNLSSGESAINLFRFAIEGPHGAGKECIGRAGAVDIAGWRKWDFCMEDHVCARLHKEIVSMFIPGLLATWLVNHLVLAFGVRELEQDVRSRSAPSVH